MGISFTTVFTENETALPETRLWRGVLITAIDDACQLGSDRKTSINKSLAYQWMREPSDDFDNVCFYGGFDPVKVHADFNRAIERGDVMFNEKQIAWSKYYHQFKTYKRNSDHGSRPYHRKRMEHLKKCVDRSSNLVMVSMVAISVLT